MGVKIMEILGGGFCAGLRGKPLVPGPGSFETISPGCFRHQLEQAGVQPPPYAMNYTDEAARTLGVNDGKWEAFDTHSSNPMVPSLQGGIDHGGAMISLQWRPGQ